MFRIIIVDDEYYIREGLSSYINAECKSFCVSGVFEDGSEALQYIRSHSAEVDVVLSDIRMSDISGIQLAQIIHNEFTNIYVVFISGYTEFEYARKALEFNVVDYLLKPIAFDELESVLRRLEKKLKADNELSEQNGKIENQQFIMGKLLSESELNKDESKEIQNQIVHKAVQYMNQNYGSDISLTEMAERYYMNPSYFGRLFKMHVKESFIDYLIKIRIKKATELLENTNMKVSDVAKAVGYPDLNYFIRLFKRRMGETPGEYRKRGTEYEK